MGFIWFWIVAVMIVAYVIFDGREDATQVDFRWKRTMTASDFTVREMSAT